MMTPSASSGIYNAGFVFFIVWTEFLVTSLREQVTFPRTVVVVAHLGSHEERGRCRNESSV